MRDTERAPSAARKLAETTGEPIEKFTPADEVEMPEFEELEPVPEEDW